VQLTFEAKPENRIGEKAYDSDRLDAQMRMQGTEMISPHRRQKTQDAERPPAASVRTPLDSRALLCVDSMANVDSWFDGNTTVQFPWLGAACGAVHPS
jgi:hypothetical protein